MANLQKFAFKEMQQSEVNKLLRNLDPRKATGCDNMPPKLLRVAADEITQPVTNLINMSFHQKTFPSDLKRSEISPKYKKDDSLKTTNYRPVGILKCLSKIFERVYHDQMYTHYNAILSSRLAAYRKHYSCEHVLIKLVEDCKAALDGKKHVGLVLTDLSKAFDCLPHRLMLAKLNAYGMSMQACELIR